MRITARLVAILTTAVIAGACGDSTSPKGNDFAGRYALFSLDGSTLPLTLYEDPTIRLTLQSGALTLNTDKTFIEEVHVDVAANGFPTPPELLTCNGTFVRSGNTFTMTSTASDQCDAYTATGVLSGKTLTVDDQGQVLVFKR